jgi:uncharacterized repeat protein (TIGR03803 family)
LEQTAMPGPSSFLCQPARLIITFLLLLAGSFACHAEDSYNGTELTIPSLVIGNGTYSDVVVTPLVILSVQGGTAVGSADSYDPATNELTIPAVFYAGTTYTNVVITVKRLLSIGGVTGVDTYYGAELAPELFIPSVQVLGGSVFSDVVITEGKIISWGGGMPRNVRDVYDPSTKQLTIAALPGRSEIYTNVVINVGAIISVGSTSPFRDSVLYSFAGEIGGVPGAGPMAPLVQGSDGNFYGTTSANEYYFPIGFQGPGTVFKITPAGAETLLYAFGTSGSADGSTPVGALIQGKDGNFYGTTSRGGAYGNGTVFKITPAGAETVLYSFFGGLDGVDPAGGLIQDSDGNFYGTTTEGGQCQVGVVFKVTPTGAESVLHAFTGGDTGCGTADGGSPNSGLILGTDGNFYGTTASGGVADAPGAGTVFKITPAGAETVLYAFKGGGSDGESPTGGVIQASDGNYYGATSGAGAYDEGTVFKITPGGVETLLYSFEPSGSVNAVFPSAGLIQASDGNFYGTAFGGAYGEGAVYKITLGGVESLLYSFGPAGSTDGVSPVAGLVQASDGSFYGTTEGGGATGNFFGTVFKLTAISAQ